MSDATPLLTFHRALRTSPDLGCVLDPWASRRAYQCEAAPDFTLEPLDCVLNKFKELPTRMRGAVPIVPFMDLGEVRGDPILSGRRDSCQNQELVDLLSAFDRAGVSCSALCGALPYGDDPSCASLVDDMGINMSGCFEDLETQDPGFMTPQSGISPQAPGLAAPPPPVRPVCPLASSSASACVETCATLTAEFEYVDFCLYKKDRIVCVCGDLTRSWLGASELVGCDCCHSSSSSVSSSSESSSSSASSASSVPSSSSESSSSSSSSSSASSASSASSVSELLCVKRWEREDSCWVYNAGPDCGTIDCRGGTEHCHPHSNNTENTLWLTQTFCVTEAEALTMTFDKFCLYVDTAHFCNGAPFTRRKWVMWELQSPPGGCDSGNCYCDTDLTREGPSESQWTQIPGGGEIIPGQNDRFYGCL